MIPHDINPISKPDFMPVGELRALQLAKLQKFMNDGYIDRFESKQLIDTIGSILRMLRGLK